MPSLAAGGPALAMTLALVLALFLDPATATLPAEREVVADPRREQVRALGAPAGTVVGDVDYEERAVVDEVGVRP